MSQREHNGGPPRGPGHYEHPHDRDRYASREYEDTPSLTDREWGPARVDEQHSFGQRGLGGHGDPGQGWHSGDRDYQPGQGGYAQDQGLHAQSGQARGGSRYAQEHREVSRGPQRDDSARGNSQRGRGPVNYLRSDARIADEVIDRLTDDDQLDASQILVLVENGVVTLTGEVEARWMKHRAEDITDEVSGVRDIHNQVVVDPGVRSFGPAGVAVRSGHDQAGSGFSSSAPRREPPSADR